MGGVGFVSGGNGVEYFERSVVQRLVALIVKLRTYDNGNS